MYYKDHYKLKFEFPEGVYSTDTFDIRELNDRLFDCNIFHSTLDSKEAKIQILYERTDHFYSLFPALFENGVEILKYLKVSHDDAQLKPDFSQCNILRIEDDHGYWENGKQNITIVFDKCYLHSTSSKINKRSFFILSENSNWIHDEIFKINFFEPEDPDSLSYEDKFKNKFLFGDFEVEIGINFKRYYDEEPNIWSIKRSTSIFFRDYNNFTSEHISSLEEHVKILTLLFSFYQGQEVEFTYGDVSFESGHLSIYRTTYLKPEVDKSKTVYYIKETPLVDYLERTNYAFISENYAEIQNIVSQFIYSNSLIGHSRFMILYNCIELIRNFYISFAQKYNSDFVVSDEYEFIHGNDKTNKLIKEKIKEIAEIVKQEQKCLFISEAKNKVTFIRKKRITDQFLEFFKYVKVDPNSYDLDFELLIGIRNKLYHGNAINSSIDISTINLNLYKLAVDLIIKLTSLTS
ncbi:MAG: hypothetical protein IPG12_04785 [Saprospiraceae bacterium]|nr:hypothetical protein [Saprospiraceae bacterium]